MRICSRLARLTVVAGTQHRWDNHLLWA